MTRCAVRGTESIMRVHAPGKIAFAVQLDERIRELVVSRAQSWEIKDYAVKSLGMIPLRQDGVKKAEKGLTTLEEVIAVTSEE